MKVNHIILYISIAIVIIWVMMKCKSEGYEEADKEALDAYIIEQEKLELDVIMEMASKLTSDEKKLEDFRTFTIQDDRMGLFKLTSEF